MAAFQRIIEKHSEDADCFIHLGDGEREVDEVRSIYPQLAIHFVRGNCDFGSVEPASRVLDIGGKRIFYTHGHEYGVKFGLDTLKQTARRNGAQIVLFGHTHTAFTEYDDGLYLMNPGSAVHPRNGRAGYGMVDITDAGIVTNLVRL